MYQGPPRTDAPHALLASEQHSNGYANVGHYLKNYPAQRKEFAKHLLDLVRDAWWANLAGVVGADTSSTDLAQDMAELAGLPHIRMVKTADKSQVWHSENKPLGDYSRILQVEELVTTAFSALAVREGVKRAHPGITILFAPYLPVVVDRSDPRQSLEHVDGSGILSLLRLPITNYDPAQCPYCQAGSEAIKPKEGDNWKRLTALQQ